MRVKIDPLEVQRQVVTAFAIEVTMPKPACTSRFRDVGPKQRFEYFLLSAINSGRWFHDLAERIGILGRQPPLIYDLAYKALMTSQQGRTGKIVNYGLLEAMFPVVAARCLYPGTGYDILRRIQDVLQQTSREDVRYLAQMRKEIYSRSDKEFKRKFRITVDGENVLEHYQMHAKRCHESSRLFVNELANGLPLTTLMYEHLRLPGLPLKERICKGFSRMRRASKMPAGALADFTAAAIYLAISDDPEGELLD
ncbi:MAG: triphosphoribosyl-dephospho-CoA synthase [Nitrospirota bacterium]|nr:triphosphoribosyl-dephospho-CoA synthase [Nitrospirota bacterium]